LNFGKNKPFLQYILVLTQIKSHQHLADGLEPFH